MIQSLSQAKEYVFKRIADITGETVNETEKAIVSTLLEERFYDQIGTLISDEEMESLKVENEKELEGKLFYKIPNYVSILEECTAGFLADYLSPSADELDTADENEE